MWWDKERKKKRKKRIEDATSQGKDTLYALRTNCHEPEEVIGHDPGV